MCGRYFFGAETERDVEIELGLEEGSFIMSSGDITPAMSPKVITAKKSENGKDIRVTDMFWGLTGRDKKLIINARAESATTRPMFSDSVLNRRCIIPAAGFYEWDKDKNKVTFFKKDKSPIYLAGFYQMSDNKDSFVILTTAANESMIKVHDRMPLMIEKNNVRDWLCDKDAAKEMLSMKMPLLESHKDYEQLSLFS
jgi:putative SOS response-associated peptidase YedK